MQKKVTKKLKVVSSNTKVTKIGKSLIQDTGYVRRDSNGQFMEKPASSKTKGDKMFEKVWQDIHERRDQRVG